MKSIIILTVFILSMISLSACSGSATPNNPITPQSVSPTESRDTALPLTDHGEQIVAHVNQQPITLIELEHALSRYATIPNGEYDRYLARELDKIIHQALINQLAEAHQIRVDPSEVDAEYQAMRQIMPDQAVWEQWLKDNRFINDRDFWVTTLDALTTARLQEMVLNNAPDITIPQLKARHILVHSHEQAVIAYNRLQAGDLFEVVAQELSFDPISDLGTDGGWFTADELSVPELAQIALNQPIGAYSQPIETALGWHIVQTLEQANRPPSPEEMAIAQAQLFEDWLQTQINQARIERYIN